ncbi:methanolan biosynthesis protein EpsI [Pediococcus ethanolidurans]|uniref:capsular polysaccharide synthesis protein n=1 Tax=Pediococcus ethanolidurans TaxID=319653 RepID=UPI0021AAF7A7|nr:capsular polysaccharide synthesis protein [Pediococcus ethanolidurans]MCT4397413.1 methanolan biosynthesis protein EpsI [Pediococcus ethanolidurans]
MKKIKIIFQCFGIFEGLKYILLKSIGLITRIEFIFLKRRPQYLAKRMRLLSKKTDLMVEAYIYNTYQNIFLKYKKKKTDDSEIPDDKTIWTAWLQGEKNAPKAVKLCFESMRKNSGDFNLVIITSNNLKDYIDIDDELLKSFKKGEVSAAHLTDYIRVLLLKKYGGVWIDATLYLVKPLPDSIWEGKLLIWNQIQDLTGGNLYASIPFVENFSNGFMVAKKNSIFYKFAADITKKILADPILDIDYFANFKAYLKALQDIDLLAQEWENVQVVAPLGEIIKQYWNKPINSRICGYIADKDNLFFKLTYKDEWKKEYNNVKTVQQYLVEKY